MNQITDNDWDTFNRAYEALVARDAAQRRALDTNDTKDVQEVTNAAQEARMAWRSPQPHL